VTLINHHIKVVNFVLPKLPGEERSFRR